MKKGVINKKWIIVIGTLILLNVFISKKLVQVYPIVELYSYQEVKQEINSANEDTLVLFDVDDTLISTHDVVARGSYYPWSLIVLAFIRFPYFLNTQRFEEAYSIVLTQARRELVDSAVIGIINDFHKKKSLVLALTKIETGSFGVVSDIAQWRYENLDNMGIRFSKKFGNAKFVTLKSYRGYYPELYNGIICTNRQPKDKVLEAFLDYTKVNPSKIIFFDDKKSNLQLIGDLCNKRNISCRLYHVRIVDDWAHDWNISNIFKQIKILAREKRWISNKELS